ncbi:MAG: hypothetical protein ACJATI_003543, partial [Halioglobus sp.]
MNDPKLIKKLRKGPISVFLEVSAKRW